MQYAKFAYCILHIHVECICIAYCIFKNECILHCICIYACQKDCIYAIFAYAYAYMHTIHNTTNISSLLPLNIQRPSVSTRPAEENTRSDGADVAGIER